MLKALPFDFSNENTFDEMTKMPNSDWSCELQVIEINEYKLTPGEQKRPCNFIFYHYA
jgi:hypothetical protein